MEVSVIGTGFTLIETLVVVAIVVAVAVASFAGLSAFRSGQAVKSGLDEIRAAVEATKKRSLTQEQGNRWGVRFTNATSGTSSYSIFKGSSYTTGGVDRTYSFRNNIEFGNPHPSSTYDVAFAPLSGALSENKVITVKGGRAGTIGDLILRTIGPITTRFDTGLAGYWHMDEGTATTTYDASGNANTGTLTNGPTWQSGSSCKAGTCLSFDGVNNYVQAPLVTTQTDNWTIMAWAKSNTTTGIGGVVQIGGPACAGFSITRSSVNWYPLYPCVAWNPVIASVAVGEWIHLAVVRENGVMRAYANGVQTVSGVTSVPLSPSGNYTEIGATERTSGGNYLFNGAVDEVRIYSRALSAAEVLSQYDDLK